MSEKKDEQGGNPTSDLITDLKKRKRVGFSGVSKSSKLKFSSPFLTTILTLILLGFVGLVVDKELIKIYLFTISASTRAYGFMEIGSSSLGFDLWEIGFGLGNSIGGVLFERNFLLRKRVLYFLYGVRKAVQNCLWLGRILVAWHFLFDKRVERETGSDGLRYVTKVLVCFLVGNLIWLVNTLIVKFLASHFHVSTYFDRI